MARLRESLDQGKQRGVVRSKTRAAAARERRPAKSGRSAKRAPRKLA
jgi:hypothetical protein